MQWAFTGEAHVYRAIIYEVRKLQGAGKIGRIRNETHLLTDILYLQLKKHPLNNDCIGPNTHVRTIEYLVLYTVLLPAVQQYTYM